MTGEAVTTARPRGSLRLWLGLFTLFVAAALYARAWSTQSLVLRDGRTFAVLNFDRHVTIQIGPDGSREAEHYFWVRYYSHSRSTDGMLEEARALAPVLSPMADSLGYTLMQLSPSRPLLSQTFPLGV